MSKSRGEALRLSAADRDRFASKVLTTAHCAVWTGAIGSDGYGRFALARPDDRPVGTGQRTVSTHIVAAVLAGAELPPGVTVLHDCDFRLCVRTDPGHVRVSTQRENVQQAVRRGRSRGPLPGRVDVRGPAGASRAVRDALRAAVRASADRDPVTDPAALALIVREVLAQGDPLRDNLALF